MLVTGAVTVCAVPPWMMSYEKVKKDKDRDHQQFDFSISRLLYTEGIFPGAIDYTQLCVGQGGDNVQDFSLPSSPR